MGNANDDIRGASESPDLQLLSTFARRVRTSMRTLKQLAETAVTLEDGGDQSLLADEVSSIAISLLSSVRDVLTFAEVASGQTVPSSDAFNLRGAVRNVAELLADRAKAKGLHLTVQAEDDIPCIVLGDLGRYRQILLHLVSNVIQFTDQGSVTICLSKTGETENGVEIRTEVCDAGVGIASADHKVLFTPFRQTRRRSTTPPGGTGCGLAISEKIVHSLEGRIGFSSDLGKGANFWFTLPMEQIGPRRHTAAESSYCGGERILVATDNTSTRETVIEWSQARNLQVMVIKSAAEALEILRQAAEDGDP